MAVSRVKTFIADETATASDVNAEFNNILNNGEDLGWPATKAKDLNGQELILDADGDTSITASTDDRVDFRIAGVDMVTWDAALNGAFVFNETSADLDFRIEGNNTFRAFFLDAGQDAISLGGANVDGAAFTLNNLQQRTHVTSVGSQCHVPAQTTDFDNPNGTIAIGSALFVGIPTWTNANATLTMTTAASFYIQGAPVGSTNVTVSTGYALWVDAGNVQFDGALNVTGAITEANSQVNVVGKQTIWVPAAAMRPTVSNGCAPLTDVETTAGRPDMTVLDFGTSADEHAQFQVAFPKMWNLGTVTFQAFWTVTAAVSTGIAIALQGLAITDNTTINQAYSDGTPIVVTDDAQGASNELLVTAESAAITIANTPADDDLSYFRVLRDVGDGNDDMTQDMRLLGIKFFLTTDAKNDA